MPVSVARDVPSWIREHSGSIVLQAHRASDPRAAAEALHKARAELFSLDVNFISSVVLTPEGPFVFIDAKRLRPDALDALLTVVVRRLQEADVSDAVITVPEQFRGPIMGLQRVPRAVVLRLYTSPRLSAADRLKEPPLAPTWVDEALCWINPETHEGRQAWMAMGWGVEMLLSVEEARPLFEAVGQTLLTSAPATRMPTDEEVRAWGWAEEKFSEEQIRWMSSRLRGAHAHLGSDLALAAGGHDTSDDMLLTIFDQLKGIARKLAPDVEYAYIALAPSFAALTYTAVEWAGQGGAAASSAEHFCDEFVLDAFPYQVLGPGHLARLGGAPPGTTPLQSGRVEMSIGEPSDWLIDTVQPSAHPGDSDAFDPDWIAKRRRDPDIQQRARSLLSPCLLSAGGASEIYRRRWEAGQANGQE